MENSKVIFGNELLDAYKNDMDNAVVNTGIEHIRSKFIFL